MSKQQGRDDFYLERITDYLFRIKRQKKDIGRVVDTGNTGAGRYVAVTMTNSAQGKTRKQEARRLLAEEAGR